MSSNYYKYYHLRASPISKYEQPGQSSQQSLPNQSPLQYSGSKVQQETSPWRNLPSQSQAVQSQISSSTYTIGDKTLQHLSLEKQNECLRKEKSELENQIQKLKLYYTKQTTLDQQELMRYEREKAQLADKLREMDEMLTNLQEKYEKELNVEKNNNRKQRQEWEGKIERITSYYNEQLSLKQEEIHKTKNKLQLSEINVTDLTAKLKIFEQTNKELRQKWDEDIKNFGLELESLNKQLLSQRYRNDELERLAKLNKVQNSSDHNQSDEQNNLYLKEIETLKNQSLDLRNRNFELEKKLKTYETKSLSESEIQNSIFKDKLEQKIQENEKIKSELNKKISESEILLKDNQILQIQLKKSDKDNTDKDVLVQQMISHIEQLEKENREFQSGENFSGIEEKLNQLHLENQIQKQELDFLANELERITNRNRLLEEQLYQPENSLNTTKQYQILEKQLDKIEMKCNQIKLDLNKKEESFIQSNRGENSMSVDPQQQQKQIESFGEIQKEFNSLSHDVEKLKEDISQQKQCVNEEEIRNGQAHIEARKQSLQDNRQRLATANFSPVNTNKNEATTFNPHSKQEGEQKPVAVEYPKHEKQDTNNINLNAELKSEFKKDDTNQEEQLAQVQAKNTPTNQDQEIGGDNASQQTFGGRHKNSIDQIEKLKQIEELIGGHSDKVKEEDNQPQEQIQNKADASPQTNNSPNNLKPLHQQLKELSDQYQQKDFKPIHPMNLTPKVQQLNNLEEIKKQENIAFIDSFRDHEASQQQQQQKLLQQQKQQQQAQEDQNLNKIIRINDIQQTESYIENTTPLNNRRLQHQQMVTPPLQSKKDQILTPPPRQQEATPIYSNYNILPLKTPKIDQLLIELDIQQILNYSNIASNSSDNTRYQFDKNLEGSEIFDVVIGFVGSSKSGKSAVINSIKKEDWDITTKSESCNKRMQLYRYSCMNKKVGLCESDLIADQSFMHFICNFAQALVLLFNSWESADERTFVDYVKLLQSEPNFASECIVIHSNSELLSTGSVEKITKDLTKLQDGLYRGKVEGKYKKINVYHIMLHNYNDKTKKKSIFEETIAVCRGTIIGKLTTSKEKVDVFKRLNRFLIS
ncbi:hypothetical protein ABPG74_014709 [Tetrahymena malaccensis]